LSSGLRESIAAQQQAVTQLERVRAATKAWSDDARQNLDAQALAPLLADGRRLLDRLRQAAREIATEEQRLR
jgi:hypothetical protein